MPLEKMHKEANRVWALWRITEEESVLASQVEDFETLSPSVKHPRKRLEFFAGRVLVRKLMEAMQLKYSGVTKDTHGKPFPAGSTYQLSLSHSYPYVAALLDANESVGIDLEQPKAKLLNIAPRVLSATELADAGTDIIKHCIYWSAKETMIKIHGKKDLVLAEELLVAPFFMEMEGNIIGRIIVDGIETTLTLHYIVTDGFVLVFNKNAS